MKEKSIINVWYIFQNSKILQPPVHIRNSQNRVAFWHQPRMAWCRWLHHLVLVIVSGSADGFDGFLGPSLKALWSPHESAYRCSQETPGPERGSSYLSFGLLTDPSFHEWLFSPASASFLSLSMKPHPSAIIQMTDHTHSFSFFSMPPGNTPTNLWQSTRFS